MLSFLLYNYMIYSQINITKSDHKFKYAVEYIDNDYFVDESVFSYVVNGSNIVFKYDGQDIDVVSNLRRDTNCWYAIDAEGTTEHLPEHGINISSLNLYFPRYSVDTYTKTLYALEIYTYINGIKVTLGNYLLNRYNALACDKQVGIKNNRFYEYINVPFIDPWYLIYSDDWTDFRSEVCGEPQGINNTGTMLMVSLTPVIHSEDDIYILTPECVGGTNNMMLSYEVSDYMSCVLSIDDREGYRLVSEVRFNDVYDGDFDLYLQEGYGLDTTSLHTVFELVVKDRENIYSFASYPNEGLETSHIFTKQDVSFTDWSGFADGMFLCSSASIYNDRDELVMSLLSNELPLTQEEYSKIICKDIDYINIDEINMNNYTINAVNKIRKEVISVNRPDDYKTNIIKPIFVRTMPADRIVVHPGVVESLSINLDSYKNYSKMFYIRIEGIDFVETARTIYGVVFNIIGSKLPQENTTGIYYILDEDKELVTTGSYIYEI